MGQPQGLPLQISGNRLGEDHAGRRPAHPGGLVPAYSHLEERWGNPVVTLFSFPILHSPFSILHSHSHSHSPHGSEFAFQMECE